MSAPAGAAWGDRPGNPRRTGQPVRRNSYNVGEREHRVWHALGETKKQAWRFKDALVRAAKRIDDDTKGPNMRMGAIGLTGVKVLEALCAIVDNMTGRLEPAIDTIAARCRLARGTVIRALARLKEAGFLDWFRRTEALDAEGAGPRVQQATNAYWFALRGRAAGLVRLMLGKAPPTKTRDDAQAEHSAERLAGLQAMRATGPRRSRAEAAELLHPAVREVLDRRARERLGASPMRSQNPGSQGEK